MAIGQPEKLTLPLSKRICAYVEGGSFMETAAEASGIHRNTLRAWLKKGARERIKRRRGKEPDEALDRYVQFSAAMDEAWAKCEIHSVELIQTAAKIDWRAAAFHLERTRPKRWGRKIEIAADAETKADWVTMVKATKEAEQKALLRGLKRDVEKE